MPKKIKYDAMTTGKIVNLKRKNTNSPITVVAEYFVSDKKYIVSERLNMRIDNPRPGFLPSGQSEKPIMKNISIGAIVHIRYNSDKPSMASIKENEPTIISF